MRPLMQRHSRLRCAGAEPIYDASKAGPLDIPSYDGEGAWHRRFSATPPINRLKGSGGGLFGLEGVPGHRPLIRTNQFSGSRVNFLQ
jgi:hypothetical protein